MRPKPDGSPAERYGSQMFRSGIVAACCALVLPLLAACGSDAPSPLAGGTVATSDRGSSATGRSTAAASTAGGRSRAGSVDVCALLTQADAAAVARERGLNGAQTAATKYTLKATKQTYTNSSVPTSGCAFSIDGEGASGTVVIQVMPGDLISSYTGGEKVAGLGDEAYDSGGSTVVRVGNLMMEAAENSFTNGFVVALFRRMIPRLR